METTFQILSDTYAEKAKRLFHRSNLQYSMQKNTTREGCTFVFSVFAATPTVLALLQQEHIPYRYGG